MMCSILSPRDYAPFGETNAGEFHEKIVIGDYLDARHLGNCFAIARELHSSLLRKIIILVIYIVIL